MNWREFWDADTPIYVSERHKTLHYAAIARDVAAYVPGPGAHVLDHGCGEALGAGRVAAACARLWLLDGAPTVRARLAARFAGEPKIAVLAPEEADRIPDGSLDLAVAVSLLQYLSLDELRDCLVLWRAKLKDDGRLVLADVIPPERGPLDDVRALLRFASAGGFLGAALVGLARTAVSPYRRLRSELGLERYGEAEMVALLAERGFAAERAPRNLGHDQGRMTFVARPR